MAFRIAQESGKSGWYVFVDRPKNLRVKRGGKTVRRKGGETREEAIANALRIEASLVEQWVQEADVDPFQIAKKRSQASEFSLDEELDLALREERYKPEVRDRLINALLTDDTSKITREEKAKLEEINSDERSWQAWVSDRRLIEKPAASTARNWGTKLKQLSEWYRSDLLAMMTRKEANPYRHHLTKKGHAVSYVIGTIGSLSGMWNWAITAGEIKTENIWTGLKKGLPKPKKRESVSAEMLQAAEAKADKLKDIRFWFGRYQGLRKEDYCGLRWCDIDIKEGVIHIQRYVWEGKKRNLKLKEGGERTIPIHSKLLARIKTMLPEAERRCDKTPVWPQDYKPSIENWGSTWAARHSDRYCFGSHDLRSYVVTQMMLQNINPYYLAALTGHTVQGTSEVVRGYVTPTIEQVREVLELLD